MTGPKGPHTHQTRYSRDECDAGRCDRLTVKQTWPSEIKTPDVGSLSFRLLNNIEVVQIFWSNSYIPIDQSQIKEIVTILQYADWYFTEGKYDEQTSPQ